MTAVSRLINVAFAVSLLLCVESQTKAQVLGSPGSVGTGPTFGREYPRDNPFAASGAVGLGTDDLPEAKPSRDVVYLGNERIAVLGPLVQVTLNAHVSQYQFAPKKSVAAVVGTRVINGKTVPALWLCDAKTGTLQIVPVPSLPAIPGNVLAPFVLHGWDGSGRFLLVSQVVPCVPLLNRGLYREARVFCLDTNTVPVKVTRVHTPDAVITIADDALSVVWSPSRRRVLLPFVQLYSPEIKLRHHAIVYDLKQGVARLLTMSPFYFATGWRDEAHVGLSGGEFDNDPSLSCDIVSGRQTPAPPLAPGPTFPGAEDYPGLWNLTVNTVNDMVKDHDNSAYASVTAVWLDLEHSHFRLSRALVSLSPDTHDPQAAWSVDGAYLGFVAHGDLFFRCVTARPATLEERFTAGDVLMNAEKETLAVQIVRHVYTALLQDIRETDIYYPSTENFAVSIIGFLPPDTPLSLYGHPFVYHAPPPRTTPQYPDMANFVLGEFNLSHVTVTLYGDGRVVSMPHLPDVHHNAGTIEVL